MLQVRFVTMPSIGVARLIVYTGSFHSPPKASAGHDHFVDPDSPNIPPPIPAWSAALNRVQNDSPSAEPRELLSGYYVPHPMTFAEAGSLARYLETWLTIRPLYLQHLLPLRLKFLVLPLLRK